MICERTLCDEAISSPVESKRSDSIVYGMVFCSSRCRALEAAVRKQRKNRDPVKERWLKVLRKYGITREEWETLYQSQEGRCPICDEHLEGKKACVDHDHETGEVRGILCNECNHGLGKFRDDPERLMKAAHYVKTSATTVARLLGGDGR